MKKILAMILVIALMAAFFTACASDTASDDASAGDNGATSAGDTADTGDGTYSMTFIMPTRNEFNTAMADGMQQKCDELDVVLTMQDVNNDSSKVIQFVESARNAGDDAVIVLPVDSETIPQIVEAAGDMKVVIVNRAPKDMSVFGGSLAYVGSDEWQAGTFQGEYLAEVLTAAGETVAKPIFLLGTVGAENTTARTESAKQALTDGGLELEVVAELAPNWDRAEALTKIQPLVNTADYNCVIANNDDMALGAIEALQAGGIDLAEVPVVGIDATVNGVEAVVNGTLAMTVFQDAAGQGIGSVVAAVNMIEGKGIAEGTDYTVDEENTNVVWIPFVPVTAENVADFQ